MITKVGWLNGSVTLKTFLTMVRTWVTDYIWTRVSITHTNEIKTTFKGRFWWLSIGYFVSRLAVQRICEWLLRELKLARSWCLFRISLNWSFDSELSPLYLFCHFNSERNLIHLFHLCSSSSVFRRFGGSCYHRMSSQSDSSSSQDGVIARVVEYMKQKDVKRIIVLAGAGISTASGIPDFR